MTFSVICSSSCELEVRNTIIFKLVIIRGKIRSLFSMTRFDNNLVSVAVGSKSVEKDASIIFPLLQPISTR